VSVKRRDIREAAFLLIYERSFRQDEPLETIFENAREVDEFPFNEEVEALVRGVDDKRQELDELISQFSNKRVISRIPKVNLAVLRLAVYEAAYVESVPVNVAISEAVAIADMYTFDPDVSFINGVLGSYSKSLSAEQK
jgi:N utilization substance protein B